MPVEFAGVVSIADDVLILDEFYELFRAGELLVISAVIETPYKGLGNAPFQERVCFAVGNADGSAPIGFRCGVRTCVRTLPCSVAFCGGVPLERP